MTWAFLGLAAFFILSVKRPTWALGGILALLPTYMIRLKMLNIPTTALELLVGIFLLAVILTHFNQDSWKRVKSLGTFNWLVGAFVLAAIVSSAISPEKARALGQLKAYFVEPVLVFYSALLVMRNKEDVRRVLGALFASASLISLVGIVQYWTHIFLPLRFWGYGVEMKRITSIFEYPNALALYLAPLFVFFLTLKVKGYRLMGAHWEIMGLVLMAATVILTYSRGAWLGVIAGVFVLAIRQTGVSLKKWGIAAILGAIILSPILITRFKSTFHDGASSERLKLYAAAQDKLTQNPFFGNGLYGFRQTLENADYTGEILNYPHNIILNFWVETGLLGMLSFALIVLFALKRYKDRPTVLKFAAGLFLLALVTHGMVDAPYFKNDLSVLFWSVLSLFYLEE
jgi:putative inorganic carbon (hco3(-)) transporter